MMRCGAMMAWSLTVALGVVAFAPTASAEAASAKPASLQELLKRVKDGWKLDSVRLKKREQAFLSAKNKQQDLLRRAKTKLETEDKRAGTLEVGFQENEVKIAELEETLRSRLGTMGELFGVIRQVAGDTRGHVEGSFVSAQLKGRGNALKPLAESKKLPSVEQLEGLWFTLQQEMVESGKVARFKATVVDPGGLESMKDVVRVGVFNAVADGKFLTWNASQQKLVELARQPESRHLATAQKLQAASSGMVRMSVDPSRGQLLEMLVQTPNFRERLEFGGSIGLVVMILGAIAFLLGLARLVILIFVSVKVRSQQRSSVPSKGNPLGRVLSVYAENPSLDTEALELKLDEAVLREQGKLERFLWAVKVVSVVAPLMGLLGTVTGMIRTFQSIVLFGAGEPKMMANGISEALVTTMLGLIVAIPLVLLHSSLRSMSRRLVEILGEQSAGMVASLAEREKKGESAH